MCGIAGKINWKGQVAKEEVARMCDKMVHRGPDDYDIVVLKNAAFGHRRLSIIDLSRAARQPMSSSDGRYFIVYNGEVYNFRELKKDLELEGVIFRTQSDTEVVLYSYIKWGHACLSKFNGMFAFAVWDEQLKELFLASDRFAKKPLYYYSLDEKFAFASELGALVCASEIPRNISYEALNSYLALGYILSPMSFYKDIFKLESATFMLVSGGKIRTKERYWDYSKEFRKKIKSDESAISENIQKLLDQAVRRRMVSDVPVGAFLSGGIDSSSVTALMKRYQPGQLHTFSIGFSEESYNEIKDAFRAAKWIGSIHHDQIFEPGKNLELVKEALEAYDEPFADNSCIPTFALAKLTSRYVKVALSGDGADEVFAGYITYKADKYYHFARLIPLFLRKLLANPGTLNRAKRKKLSFGYKQKQFFYGSLYAQEKAHYLWRIIFHPEERVALLGEKQRELVYDTDPFFYFKKFYEKADGLEWPDKSLYVDAMTWLSDDILVKVDRASMRNSIEVRSPYLDIDLVNYSASIPARLKMKGLKNKYILKRALKNILPDFIINKRKSGFGAPVGEWLSSGEIDEFRLFNKYVFDRKVKS